MHAALMHFPVTKAAGRHHARHSAVNDLIIGAFYSAYSKARTYKFKLGCWQMP